MSQSNRRVVASKDFLLAPCSIPRVLPATRHQWHPCSALVPASKLRRFCAFRPPAVRAADAGIPEQGRRQIERSSFVHPKRAAVISRASLVRALIALGRLARVES